MSETISKEAWSITEALFLGSGFKKIKTKTGFRLVHPKDSQYVEVYPGGASYYYLQDGKLKEEKMEIV